ncbi:B2 bradykinin receptor-like [Myxocyprinus asiaticus]|uniref:B2 bradykinin receptor-like n=1 Tax=Myxocyprinus asiaticus TaxID=70543 RepID=UPI0022225AC5|nr:B2 bradykinin receptor-like [Myxocyprinus asiaticus]
MELNSSDSLCNETIAWIWLSSLHPPFLALVSILGVVGNILVLCVFCLQQKPCSVADVYLGNLAAADLIMVLCLPFWTVTIAQGYQWNFGQLLCKLVNTAISMNYYCSMLFLVLVSVDRYLALAKPMKPSKLRRPDWAKRVCLVIWAVGFLLSLPTLLFRKVHFFSYFEVEACYLDYPHPAWELQWNITTNVIGLLVPLPIISFCTYHMVRALKNSGVVIQPRVQTERKATQLVLTVLAVFLFCWMPFQLVRFLGSLGYFQLLPGCLWEHILDISVQLASYLGYSNSSINPFLYVIVGSHFRKRARGVCRSLLCPRLKDKTFALTNVTVISKCSDSRKGSQDRITALDLRSVCVNIPHVSSGVSLCNNENTNF